MSTGKVFLSVVAGVAAGAAAGALLGILYAPDKGINTRRKIIERKDEITDDIKDRFNRFGDYISEKFDGAKRQAKDLIDTGKSKVHDVKREARSATT